MSATTTAPAGSRVSPELRASTDEIDAHTEEVGRAGAMNAANVIVRQAEEIRGLRAFAREATDRLRATQEENAALRKHIEQMSRLA